MASLSLATPPHRAPAQLRPIFGLQNSQVSPPRLTRHNYDRTEALFHTIVLRFAESRSSKLTQVLANVTLKVLVKKISIDGEGGSTERERDPETSIPGDNPWRLAICRLAEFPALRAVELRLNDEVAVDSKHQRSDQNLYWREDYMGLLFRGISDTRLADTTTLRNLQDALCGCPWSSFYYSESSRANSASEPQYHDVCIIPTSTGVEPSSPVS
ncbi:hypothetical protein BCR34DRAFT_590383 [Clohesyomyces aquaticus]|uniref:Uncharacterized protein n=1 Tax=Clohesyomyces aquaticus TaxID=1231657 RepID=A0A1Y1ZA24_9PLEO|nr:hypothetical protein BCR34DRAFT_590383 [Clohesyomyces aquaticus]